MCINSFLMYFVYASKFAEDPFYINPIGTILKTCISFNPIAVKTFKGNSCIQLLPF